MSKRVLITGEVGFLGVHPAIQLLKQKFDATFLDLADLDTNDSINRVKIIKCDVRDKKIIFDINISGTKNVLDASLKNKAKRLVFISLTETYNISKHLSETETNSLCPIDYYCKSKVAAEKLLNWNSQKSNEELLIESYDWHKKHIGEIINKAGITHRVD